MRLRVISGGQTGVDRAALDAALRLGLEIGGWCPRGRRAEDGVIPDGYRLRETPSRDYAERTERNVLESDGTLILYRRVMTGGTHLTARIARRVGRPLLACDPERGLDQDSMLAWLLDHRIRVLNCAGPRESAAPGIQVQAFESLSALFAVWSARWRMS